MKITQVSIRNYRCLKTVDLKLEDYTALIGTNGAGKSSVLYALDWFFNGGQLTTEDVHKPADQNRTDTVEVSVTFGNLTSRDRAQLEKYGRGDKATFKRSWTVGDPKSKIIGNALQGPGFSDIRAMTRQSDYRPAYTALRTSLAGLPDLGSTPTKVEIEEALAVWESDTANADHLVAIDAADATHLFGFSGQSIIENCFRMIMIPAASEITNEVDGIKKGSAVDSLVGALAAKASASAKEAWISKYSSAIDELSTSVRKSVEDASTAQIERVNSRLTSLIPDTHVEFIPEIPDWIPNPTTNIVTQVTIDGATNHISRQGHGIQRAVMIAMFQSLVPDREFAASYHEQLEGESEEDSQVRLNEAIEGLPVLMVCIEEPEIYQHPVRARTFARVLSEIANEPSAQVLAATHSPYFIRPEQFEGVRRFSIDQHMTTVQQATIAQLVASSGKSRPQVAKILEQKIPTTFSESFFAELVVLVEGVTDKVVLETLAEILGETFDSSGIVISDVSGKGNMNIPKVLLESLSVPTYTIFDGDADGATRRHPTDVVLQTQMRETQEGETNNLASSMPTSVVLQGSLPYVFGNPTLICESYTIWRDDIEAELENWPSFIAALSALGESIRCKDVRVYRDAMLSSDVDDIPESLKLVIRTIMNLNA